MQGGYYADVTEEARCQVDNHEKHDDDWSNDGSLGSSWVLKLTPVDDFNDLIHTQGETKTGSDGDGDFVSGGTGNDMVYGDNAGSFIEYIFGGPGHDIIYSYDGDDEIDGGEGDDFIRAGYGDN